jgi:hypothetical protein
MVKLNGYLSLIFNTLCDLVLDVRNYSCTVWLALLVFITNVLKAYVNFDIIL